MLGMLSMVNRAMCVIRLSFLLLLLCCDYRQPFSDGVKQDEQLHLTRFGDLPSGPLEDATCNIENVEEANHGELNKLLKELINTTYFRLFKVDLAADCPFWKSSETKKDQTCGSEAPETLTTTKSNLFGVSVEKEKPTLCSLETSRGKKLPWGPESAPVIKSSFVEENVSEGCKDSSLPEFWLDLCPRSDFTKNSEIEYVDLLENPEQYTGYNGTRLWDAIYQENCFSRQNETTVISGNQIPVE